jgi:hypothetical protein
MIKVSGSVLINRPPEDVSEFVSDFENAPQWQGGVVEATKLDDGLIKAGSRFHERVRIALWRVDAICTVTEYAPAQEMTFTATSRPMDYEATMTFAREAGNTRLTIHGLARMKGMWRVFEPMVGMDAKQSVKKELAALKKALESEAPATVPARG